MTWNSDMRAAPRDGRALWVADPDCGCFLMAWDRNATNEMFAPGATGMWSALYGEMTWTEHDGYGPTRWADGAKPKPDGWDAPLPPAPETAEVGRHG